MTDNIHKNWKKLFDRYDFNLDELYTKKQEQDLNVMNNYNKILSRI